MKKASQARRETLAIIEERVQSYKLDISKKIDSAIAQGKRSTTITIDNNKYDIIEYLKQMGYDVTTLPDDPIENITLIQISW